MYIVRFLPILFLFILLTFRVAHSAVPWYLGIGDESVQRPLPPDYRINPDQSIDVRVCFNWSCSRTKTLSFSTEDVSEVKGQMAYCAGDSLHERLQRIRIGIWQMELLAQKYLPVLTNDRAINDQDKDVEGRTDCVDNASNTTTFLHILDDLKVLPSWSVAPPKVRKLLYLTRVHWTAVVVDEKTGGLWSIDSWLRRHGHLPFVMPLDDWVEEKRPWEAPFDDFNPYPQVVTQLCGEYEQR